MAEDSKPPRETSAGDTTSGELVQLRKSSEDDYEAAEHVLELLGRVTENDTVDDIARAIVEGVRELLGFDRAGLFLWQDDTREFRGTFGTDVDGETTDEHDLFWDADDWDSTKLIEDGQIFIEEELDQPRPLPGEEGLKAYMVVLRFGPKLYGILSVDNRISQRLITQQELEYLTLFSRILGNAVDISRIRAEIEEKNERMMRELRLAQSIQLGFLPKRFPRGDRVDFECFYLTCDMLGGDLYDVFSIDEDRAAIYVADIAGHGVSAALISGLLKMAMASVREQHLSASGELAAASLTKAGTVLAALNEILIKEIPEEQFITMIYCVLDLPSNQLMVSSAGHPPPLLYSPTTEKTAYAKIETGPGLGLISGEDYPVTAIDLQPGDQLLFYTDGVTETMNSEREEFGEERLLQAVQSHSEQDLGKFIAAVRKTVEDFQGKNEAQDDFTMLAFRMR